MCPSGILGDLCTALSVGSSGHRRILRLSLPKKQLLVALPLSVLAGGSNLVKASLKALTVSALSPSFLTAGPNNSLLLSPTPLNKFP